MPDGLDLCEKIQGSQCLVGVSKKRRKGKGREHQRLNKIQLGWRDDSIINRSWWRLGEIRLIVLIDDETSREDVEKEKESGRCCCEEDWEKKRPPFEWGLLV